MIPSDSAKVFITHSWHDIDFARRLYDDLVKQGYQVWFDDKTLQGGHRMAEEINRGLEWCDVYLPILSANALESPWCWEELNAAISLSNEKEREGRPRIIPVLAHPCQVPAILRGRLHINLADQYSIEIGKVYSAIDMFSLELKRKQQEQAERDRIAQLAREKEEKERIARQREEEEQQAKERELAEKLAREKEEQERIARQREEEERQAKERELAEKLAREKEGQERIARQREEEERQAKERELAEKLAREKEEQERIARQREEEERQAKQIAQQKALFAQIQHLAAPLIAGNIYCVIAIAVWISDSNMLIFSCVFILLVFLVAGALSAMTHKQSPAYFRIRQAIVDGFCGGFVSSILLAIGLLLLFNLSVTNQLMNFVFGLFVAFLCLSIAGFVGGIGGWAWGLFYAIFLSKRRS